MACLNSTTRQRLIERYNKLSASLARADAAYDILLDNADIESYTFDSGDGRQTAKRRALEELRKEIESIEARQASIERRLSGFGLTNLNLSRRVNNGSIC